MPTGFLSKSTYTPTLKFNGVTGMLNRPLFTQDSEHLDPVGAANGGK